MRRENSEMNIEMGVPCILPPLIQELYRDLPNVSLPEITKRLVAIQGSIEKIEKEKLEQAKDEVRRQFFLELDEEAQTVFGKLVYEIRYHREQNINQFFGVLTALTSLFDCLNPVPFEALIAVAPHFVETTACDDERIPTFFNALFCLLLKRLDNQNKMALINNLIDVRFSYKRAVIYSTGDMVYTLTNEEKLSVLALLISRFKSFGDGIVSEREKQQIRMMFCEIFAMCDTPAMLCKMLPFFASLFNSHDCQTSYLKEVTLAMMTLFDRMRYIPVAFTVDENGEVFFNDQKTIDNIISLLSKNSMHAYFARYLEQENILTLKSTMRTKDFSLFKAVLKRELHNCEQMEPNASYERALEAYKIDLYNAKTGDKIRAAVSKFQKQALLLRKKMQRIDRAFSAVYSNRVVLDERSIVSAESDISLKERLETHINALNGDIGSSIALFFNTGLKTKKLAVLNKALPALVTKNTIDCTMQMSVQNQSTQAPAREHQTQSIQEPAQEHQTQPQKDSIYLDCPLRSSLMSQVLDLMRAMSAPENKGWDDGATGNLVSEILYELKQVVLQFDGVAPSLLAWQKPVSVAAPVLQPEAATPVLQPEVVAHSEKEPRTVPFL